MEQIAFKVPGMTCAHCERAIHDEVTLVRGVASVSIDLTTKDVVVTGTDLVLSDLVAAIEEAGYEAVPSLAPGAAAHS
jgi:copper chaperone